MAGQQVEHVVQEPDAASRAARAHPSRDRPDANLGLSCPAIDCGCAAHRGRLSRMRASIDWAWSSKPSARASGAAARASSSASRIRDLGEPPAELSRREPRGETGRAVGGKHVVGAHDVVAECRAGERPDEQAARAVIRGASASACGTRQLKVLRRELLGQRERILDGWERGPGGSRAGLGPRRGAAREVLQHDLRG